MGTHNLSFMSLLVEYLMLRSLKVGANNNINTCLIIRAEQMLDFVVFIKWTRELMQFNFNKEEGTVTLPGFVMKYKQCEEVH